MPLDVLEHALSFKRVHTIIKTKALLDVSSFIFSPEVYSLDTAIACFSMYLNTIKLV